MRFLQACVAKVTRNCIVNGQYANSLAANTSNFPFPRNCNVAAGLVVAVPDLEQLQNFFSRQVFRWFLLSHRPASILDRLKEVQAWVNHSSWTQGASRKYKRVFSRCLFGRRRSAGEPPLLEAQLAKEVQVWIRCHLGKGAKLWRKSKMACFDFLTSAWHECIVDIARIPAGLRLGVCNDLPTEVGIGSDAGMYLDKYQWRQVFSGEVTRIPKTDILALGEDCLRAWDMITTKSEARSDFVFLHAITLSYLNYGCRNRKAFVVSSWMYFDNIVTVRSTDNSDSSSLNLSTTDCEKFLRYLAFSDSKYTSKWFCDKAIGLNLQGSKYKHQIPLCALLITCRDSSILDLMQPQLLIQPLRGLEGVDKIITLITLP
eukprot:g73713.t1